MTARHPDLDKLLSQESPKKNASLQYPLNTPKHMKKLTFCYAFIRIGNLGYTGLQI